MMTNFNIDTERPALVDETYATNDGFSLATFFSDIAVQEASCKCSI